MATVLESPTATPAGYDLGTALALDSLGLCAEPVAPFTPLPARVVQGIVVLSGLVTGIVWLARLTGRG